MAFEGSCSLIGLSIIFFASIGNWLCICVFLRKRFRSSVLTPFFVALLIADCIYITFRVIKLLNYQETLFSNVLPALSCSSSWLTRIYQHFTQNAPQIFVPFAHYEFYIRFSLLLMSFLAIQRAYDMFHASFSLLPRNASTRSCSYVLIISAFILAYFFELIGLIIFCSAELSADTAYQWYKYIRTNLSNETYELVSFMKNQSSTQREIDCVSNDTTVCPREELVQIVRKFLIMIITCRGVINLLMSFCMNLLINNSQESF